jgi:hypothetical protein
MNRHSFTEPDEVRTPPKTRVEVVNLDTVKVARFINGAGWLVGMHRLDRGHAQLPCTHVGAASPDRYTSCMTTDAR